MKILTETDVISPRNVLDALLADRKGGTLFVFDVDDTLLKTSARILIEAKDGTRRNLSSGEFATYTPAEGERMDLSEFGDSEKFVNESQVIEATFEIFKKVQQEVKERMSKDGSRLILLTARNDFDSKFKVLQFFSRLGVDIGSVHIERAGRLGLRSSALNKSDVLRQYIEKNNFGSIVSFDDSKSNLEAIQKVASEESDIHSLGYLVKETGDVDLYVSSGQTNKKCEWLDLFLDKCALHRSPNKPSNSSGFNI